MDGIRVRGRDVIIFRTQGTRERTLIDVLKIITRCIVRGRYNANNQGKPFQRNTARGNVVAGNVGGAHTHRECPRPKRLQDSDYFKDKMLLMQAQENGAVLDEEQSLFLAGEQITNFDEDVDNSPENDLALNMDHIFEADECDAFDSDVDEGPTTQTMFMTNLTSEDRIYDEAGTSYDSNTPSEVQDHDAFVNHLDEYHEVHEMQTDEQHNYVLDLMKGYTSNSILFVMISMWKTYEDLCSKKCCYKSMLGILDSGVQKHMTGIRSQLMNFVEKVASGRAIESTTRECRLMEQFTFSFDEYASVDGSYSMSSGLSLSSRPLDNPNQGSLMPVETLYSPFACVLDYQAKPIPKKHFEAIKRGLSVLERNINMDTRSTSDSAQFLEIDWLAGLKDSKEDRLLSIQRLNTRHVGCLLKILWMRSQLKDYDLTSIKFLYMDKKVLLLFAVTTSSTLAHNKPSTYGNQFHREASGK
ncbi:hypothetical protein Tco_0451207 [Tanacetum coccineum]